MCLTLPEDARRRVSDEKARDRATGIGLVSFDLDGTLVDTAAEIAEAANRALADHGIGARPAAEIERLIGAGTRELMLRLLARVFLERPDLVDAVQVDDVLRDFERHYAATAGHAARPYDGAKAMLARLREAGVRLACVTNKERRHTDRVLQATGLVDAFDVVVAGDTLPEKKPHGSVLRHVARVLAQAPHCAAHVGDSAIDVAAARNAGFAAWAVPWGYNAGVPVAEASPDRLFDHLDDVAAHVLASRGAA
jgi:phosphoglycolate phosphatase